MNTFQPCLYHVPNHDPVSLSDTICTPFLGQMMPTPHARHSSTHDSYFADFLAVGKTITNLKNFEGSLVFLHVIKVFCLSRLVYLKSDSPTSLSYDVYCYSISFLQVTFSLLCREKEKRKESKFDHIFHFNIMQYLRK